MKTFPSIGAGPGIGFATAERFAKEGFRVVLAARRLAKTQELTERLTKKGYKADVRTVDTSGPKSVTALVAEVQKQYGSIDVLHYNAASMRKATLFEQPRDTFNSDLAVNIGGALAAAQTAASTMEEQKSGAILVTGGLCARSQPGLSLDQHRQSGYSRFGSRTFRAVPRKGNSHSE